MTRYFFIAALSLMLIGCNETKENAPKQYADGQLKLGFSSLASSLRTEALNSAKSILITISDESNEYVLNREKLDLFKIGDSYITRHISLNPGSYSIEEFFVLNDQDSIIYLTPLKGSEFDRLVQNPLTIDFTIESSSVSEIILEVIESTTGTPIQFGYSTFSFDIVNTLSSGLYLYLPFNENTNDKGPHNKPTTNQNVTFVPDRFNADKKAVLFDKSLGSLVSIGDQFDFFSDNNSDFSFSLWFQWNDTSDVQTMLLSKYGNGNCMENQREFYLAINRNKQIQFMYYTNLGTTNYRGIAGQTVLEDTMWHHLVVNYHSQINEQNGLDRVEIFLDNVKEETFLSYVSGSLGNIQNSTAHLGIGAALDSEGSTCHNDFGDFGFSGSIDEIRVYNRPLYQNEIDYLFNH